MMNIINNLEAKKVNGERFTREETIALRLMQEAGIHYDGSKFAKYDFNELMKIMNADAGKCFELKDFENGARIKKAMTNLELAKLWIEHNIDDTKPHISELLNKWDELKAIPREESSREISLAITALEEAMLWLSK